MYIQTILKRYKHPWLSAGRSSRPKDKVPVSSSNHKIQSNAYDFSVCTNFSKSKVHEAIPTRYFIEIKIRLIRSGFFLKHLGSFLFGHCILARFVLCRLHSGVCKISDFVPKQFKLFQCLSKHYLNVWRSLKKFVSNIFIA